MGFRKMKSVRTRERGEREEKPSEHKGKPRGPAAAIGSVASQQGGGVNANFQGASCVPGTAWQVSSLPNSIQPSKQPPVAGPTVRSALHCGEQEASAGAAAARSHPRGRMRRLTPESASVTTTLS